MSDVVTAEDLKMLDVKASDMIANDVEGETRRKDVMSPARDSVMPELRAGMVIAGVFFVGLLGWASLIPLDAAATAEGIVAVAGNRQAVQHRDGGIVTKLNATEGQFVKQGDLLLQISASELVAQERGLAGETIALLAQRARLMAERNGERALSTPLEFASLTAEDKVLADEAMRGQTLLFQARRGSVATERSVLEQRIRQHAEQISGIESQKFSNEMQKEIMNEQLDGLKKLVPSGYVALNRVRGLEREIADLDGREGTLRSDGARLTEAIGEARLEIIGIDRRKAEEVAPNCAMCRSVSMKSCRA